MKVLLWGAGLRTEWIYNRLNNYKHNDIEIIGICGNDYKEKNEIIKNGKDLFNNVELNDRFGKILSPEEAVEMFENNKYEGVINAVSEKYKKEVDEQIKTLGLFLYVVPFLEGTWAINNDNSVGDIAKCTKENVFAMVDWKSNSTWIYTQNEIFKESFNYEELFYKTNQNYELRLMPDRIIEEEVCVLSRKWTTNYWHFIYEVMDKIADLERNNYRGKYILFDCSVARNIISITDVDINRILWLTDRDDGKVFLLKKLMMVSAMQGSNPISVKSSVLWGNKVIDLLLKDYLNSKMPCYTRLYVKRIGTRKAFGVEKILEKYGFFIMIPEEHTVLEQIQFFHDADIVISPHGANSSNILFMREKTDFIELFGHNYINPCVIEVARQKNIRYQMVVEENHLNENKSLDYTVNESALEIAIENIIKR